MLESFFIVVEVLVVIANVFWEHLRVFTDKQAAFEWFVIAQFALLFGYLVARAGLDKLLSKALTASISDKIRKLESRLVHNADALRQDDFYTAFWERVAHATFAVDISHLDTHSPLDGALPGSATKKYYDEFKKLPRSRPQVRFRRVERISWQKRNWIDSLVTDMAGRPNCSLACLMVPQEPRKLSTVSVQLVDKEVAYLVAITEHVDAHSPRDLRISDPTAAEMWLAYYDEMLWRPAVKIIENGHVNEPALASIRAEMDRIRG